MSEATGYIGRRVRRVEDPRFLMGSTRYVDDIRLGGMVHAAFVRSPHAHAWVRDVRTQRAQAHGGLVAALSGRGLPDSVKPIRCDSTFPGYNGSAWRILAWPKVFFAGEAVAAVVARDRYVAEDVAELVEVDYEPLAPVVDPETAAASPRPLLHEEWPNNLFMDWKLGGGDVESALAKAEHVFEGTYRMHRHTGYPLENRACLADYSRATGILTVHTATQIPQLLRTGLADVLGLPEHRVRVVAPDVGGGFGIKGQLSPEEAVVCLLSMRLGRPVKWIEDGREHLTSSVHARDHLHRITIGFLRDGTITGVKADLLLDIGAYSVWPWTCAQDGRTAAAMLVAPYVVPHYEARIRLVATNKCPFGAYRGVGRPAAAFTMERALDDAARELGIDPVQLRLKNHVPDDAYPYRHAANDHLYDSASLVGSLKRAAAAIGYEDFRRDQERARAQGRYLGIGFATYIEQTAHTHEFVRRGVPISFAYESARVSLDPSGKFVVQTSMHSHGQGHATTFAQVAADCLGVPLADVRVEYGDTDASPYGMGSFASRGAVLGGGAVWQAAAKVRASIFKMAGHLLEASAEDLEIEAGEIWVRGSRHRSLTVAALARLAFHRAERLPKDMRADDFISTQSYDAQPGSGAWANAAHVAVVEVDVATGAVKILRYLVVEDCGTLINPLVVDGQVHGGVAQGIGGALLEHLVYDEAGQLLSQTLMEYLLPTSLDVPDIEVEHLQTPSPYTVRGIKGTGEGGAIAPMAAIGNAVTDALVPFGAGVHRLPLSPARVLAMVEGDAETRIP